ncbi:hypothetical protein EV715DRAFT_296547 [Schizophyllum commune]
MRASVARKGLEPLSALPRRYLWTDAFASFNLITLHRQGLGENGSGSKGWLTELSEKGGAAHFTRGGLRIGKPLPEHQVGELPDYELKWDQDGQYFHSKWLHDLAVMARATSETLYLVWTIEFAKAVHPRFTHSGGTRMHCKMSVDGNGQTRFRNRERLLRALEKLDSYENLADRIGKFWMKEESRMEKSWTGYEDINAVMLATTLALDAFLEPPPVRVSQAQAGIAHGLELVAHKEVLDAIDVECLRR